MKYQAPKTSLTYWIEKKQSELFERLGIFFAFNNEQFNESKKDGVKYASGPHGMVIPVNNVDTFIEEYREISAQAKKELLENNTKEDIIYQCLCAEECFYDMNNISEVYKELSEYGITVVEIFEVYNQKRAEHEEE